MFFFIVLLCLLFSKFKAQVLVFFLGAFCVSGLAANDAELERSILLCQRLDLVLLSSAINLILFIVLFEAIIFVYQVLMCLFQVFFIYLEHIYSIKLDLQLLFLSMIICLVSFKLFIIRNKNFNFCFEILVCLMIRL